MDKYFFLVNLLLWHTHALIYENSAVPRWSFYFLYTCTPLSPNTSHPSAHACNAGPLAELQRLSLDQAIVNKKKPKENSCN